MVAFDAIMIPANKRKLGELGDVELHRQHLRTNQVVFWDIIPAGGIDAPWKHPGINSGYFYISGTGLVKYWMTIEYIKQWREINLDSVRKYAPSFRKPEPSNYYAILISQLEPLRTERRLKDFRLASNNKEVERVQNYAIVKDEGYR